MKYKDKAKKEFLKQMQDAGWIESHIGTIDHLAATGNVEEIESKYYKLLFLVHLLLLHDADLTMVEKIIERCSADKTASTERNE